MQFVVSDDFNKNAVLLPLVIWQVHDRDPKDKAWQAVASYIVLNLW